MRWRIYSTTLPSCWSFPTLQTSQGVPVRRFKTLSDLIALYLQPNQGLVCTLLFSVEREKEKENVEDRDYSDGEDEKPPLPPRSGSTSVSFGPSVPGAASNVPAYLKGSYSLDLEAVRGGASSLPHLNKTLVTSCKRLHSEVDKVLSGLEILSKVFDQHSSPMVTRILQQTAGQTGEQELDSLVLKLSVLKDLLSSIEKKVSVADSWALEWKEAVQISISLGISSSLAEERDPVIQWGLIQWISSQFTDSVIKDVRQLIKSQRVQNKLGIVFEKEKDKTQRKDFIFVSTRVSLKRLRSRPCISLSLAPSDPPSISPAGSVPPSKNITSWFASKGLGKTLDEMTVTIPHDIYVFGTQENSMGDKEWVDFMRGMLKEFTEIEYRPVGALGVGRAGRWGNKGAVGVSFMFNGTSFGFVNCHLTSGNEKTARRNQNYLDILRLLSLGDKQLSSFDISLRFTHLFWFGDLNYRLDMDVQVFLGPMVDCNGGRKGGTLSNFRTLLAGPTIAFRCASSFSFSFPFPQEILNYINRKEFEPLLKVDQLNLEKEKHKIFLRFSKPSCKAAKTPMGREGVRTNVPSWCDRILWKSYPETHINSNSYGEICAMGHDDDDDDDDDDDVAYLPQTELANGQNGCTDDIVSSDHSPVFAAFEVGVTSQFVSKKGTGGPMGDALGDPCPCLLPGLSKSSDQAYIEFESVEAIVKTASRTKFFIEFYSTCLEEFKKSYENDSQSSDNINFLKVQWSSRQLPTLKPILSDIEYLQDQHILLTVKSMDGYESYGKKPKSSGGVCVSIPGKRPPGWRAPVIPSNGRLGFATHNVPLWPPNPFPGECVIALKSMIGSTAQQFLTYLSHRGEETGNIRGSMKVRVPAERMGTRERLYGEEEEDGGGQLVSFCRVWHGEVRSKPDSLAVEPEGPAMKNSFNNPAYYVLEGVPHQLLVATDPPSAGTTAAKPPAPRNKVQITVPIQTEHRRPQQPPAPPSRAEESSEEEESGVLNLPPPDFPPPPLPKSVDPEATDSAFYTSVGVRGEEPGANRARAAVAFSEPLESKPPKLHPRPAPSLGSGFSQQGPGGLLDDRSCSVLQMARTLSEVDYSSGGGGGGGGGGGSGGETAMGREPTGRPPSHPLAKVRLDLPHRCLHPDYSRPMAFPPHSIQESIKEDLAEEVSEAGGKGL
ncbi:hypothetical protein JD844_033880 [Phrynosoma platyrhinos]|uniref:Inositol polyphosphate-related phosphatase domain-containing protein n=1 Tax=Phrynosoma platyrhinos TaxID=52577 RepID=A0ABQ7T7G3_PHRPL|nr:hypothetical protein JD844_033880 [Phrynosoma platyrhinos]